MESHHEGGTGSGRFIFRLITWYLILFLAFVAVLAGLGSGVGTGELTILLVLLVGAGIFVTKRLRANFRPEPQSE